MTRIRAARSDEVEALREIERAAGQRFAEVDMAAIAASEPMAGSALEAHRIAGGLWVAVDERDRPIGFAVTIPLEGAVHVEELAVHPDAQGRGAGGALLDHVAARARADGAVAITLTTFRDVPWNQPYYERRGFLVVPEAGLGPGLAAVRADEASAGLDPALRVCMRRTA